MLYNITFELLKNTTYKFSSCIPGPAFKRFTDYTASVIYGPIFAAILGKVFQKSFAS